MKLDELINWYDTLTPDTIAELRAVYHEDARFRDPFNDVRGHRAIAAIFEHMFETTENPVFHITDTQRERDTAWVSWIFDFRLRGKAFSIEGVTRLDFGNDGRVIVHRDFWDSTDLFVRLPLLGPVLRSLRRRLSAPSHGDGDQDRKENL